MIFCFYGTLDKVTYNKSISASLMNKIYVKKQYPQTKS